MSKIELPPLPDGEGWVVRHANGDESITGWPAQQDEKLQPVFTADQLRAYGEQIVEVCAQQCEWLARLMSGPHESDGEYAVYMNAAAAIRNLIEESNNGCT
jgi:hypothetical protein